MDRPLELTVSHPQSLAFVIKLHRDCCQSGQLLRGRVEHPASGKRGEFAGQTELQSWIAQVIASQTVPTPNH